MKVRLLRKLNKESGNDDAIDIDLTNGCSSAASVASSTLLYYGVSPNQSDGELEKQLVDLPSSTIVDLISDDESEENVVEMMHPEIPKIPVFDYAINIPSHQTIDLLDSSVDDSANNSISMNSVSEELAPQETLEDLGCSSQVSTSSMSARMMFLDLTEVNAVTTSDTESEITPMYVPNTESTEALPVSVPSLMSVLTVMETVDPVAVSVPTPTEVYVSDDDIADTIALSIPHKTQRMRSKRPNPTGTSDSDGDGTYTGTPALNVRASASNTKTMEVPLLKDIPTIIEEAYAVDVDVEMAVGDQGMEMCIDLDLTQAFTSSTTNTTIGPTAITPNLDPAAVTMAPAHDTMVAVECPTDWEVVLLIDIRENENIHIQNRLLEDGLSCDTCSLALGDFLWTARRRHTHSHTALNNTQDPNAGSTGIGTAKGRKGQGAYVPDCYTISILSI